MPNLKISQLTEDASPSGDDLVVTVNDPAGTPVNRKVKILNLLKRLFLGDGTQLTVTTIADGEFLKRSGTNITSGIPTGTGAEAGANSDITSMDGLTGPLKAPTQIQDANSNEVLVFASVASAVNETKITNAATGNAPKLEATGGDTNIDLNLVSKGTGVVKANGNEVAIKNAEINAQTGTTYTLVAADNGKVVTCSNASAITVTVPSGLGAGFNCLVVQLGAGQVTFSPSSTTINNRQSHTKIAGQYGVASLVAYASNVFALGGDTAS